MNTKHTPGPWEVISGSVYSNMPNNPTCIARPDRSPSNPIPPIERDANAQLIAAAPNLLAVIIKAIQEEEKRIGMKAIDSGLGLPSFDLKVPCWLTEARRVVSEAEYNPFE